MGISGGRTAGALPTLDSTTRVRRRSPRQWLHIPPLSITTPERQTRARARSGSSPPHARGPRRRARILRADDVGGRPQLPRRRGIGAAARRRRAPAWPAWTCPVRRGSLTSYAGAAPGERRRARDGAQAISRRAAGRARRARRGREPRADGPHHPDRPRRQVLGLGVGRRRSGPGDPRPPGPAGQDHADEQRRDSALGRLPRRAHRTRQGVHATCMPGESVSYTFRANDPGVFMYHCGTKPVLMHIANGMYGAIVVEPAGRAAESGQELRPRRERVVPRLGRARQACAVQHGEGARPTARLDDLQRLRRPVRQAPADGEPRRARSLLGRRRRARRSTPTSTSSARSSTPRIRSAT